MTPKRTPAPIDVEGLMQTYQDFLHAQQELMQQAREGLRPEGSSMEKFLRLAPPSFKEESDPEVTELWL